MPKKPKPAKRVTVAERIAHALQNAGFKYYACGSETSDFQSNRCQITCLTRDLEAANLKLQAANELAEAVEMLLDRSEIYGGRVEATLATYQAMNPKSKETPWPGS